MLADEIQTDLTAAMKGRDELRTSVLRLALAAVKEARVAGEESHDLSDVEVRAVLSREAKRREEAAAAFTDAGRPERAGRELAERAVLARYLPEPMSPDRMAALVHEALVDGGFDSPTQMGPAMKAAAAKVAANGDGPVDGRAVAALVKARLAAAG